MASSLQWLEEQEPMIRELIGELARQDDKHGDETSHSAADWIALIAKHAGLGLGTSNSFRRQMLITAALALRAVRATDARVDAGGHP